jgi:hypothetical protein
MNAHMAITIYNVKKELIYNPQLQRRQRQSIQKLKPTCDLFYIEHLSNQVTLVMKEIEQEDETTIISKMKSISLV